MLDFKLRPFRDDDASSIAEYANNPKIARNLTDAFPHPYHLEDAERFISYASSHDPVQIFTIEIHGKACGGIGLHPQPDVHRRNLELGYWLAEPFWGKGIISRAITQVVNYGFNTFEVNRIFARPYGSNKPSKRVLEKCGFQLEAHLKNTIYKWDEYEDELIYAVRKENWDLGPIDLIDLK